MIFLFSILAATRALPIDPPSSPNPSLDQLQVPSCNYPYGCRSLWDIIWNSLLTILLCTWVSVHPNIPSPDERGPRILLRRVGLMVAALVVPEAIIAWALRQRQLAARLAKIHGEEGWTITHGFFATMGGFMEYDGNRPIRVLLPDQLESYSLTGNGDFPRISKADIEDKSKGDAISKALVVLQTSWFVTQCIARGVQGLPITELEIVTVAFSAFNFVIYLIWWDKPLNVRRGVRVYKKRTTEHPVDDGHVEVAPGIWVVLQDALSDLAAAVVHGPTPSLGDEMPWLFRVVIWCFTKPYQIILGPDATTESDGKRVNSFYPSDWDDTGSATSVVLAVASGFGGIHCIGWSFAFPASTEQTLWHVSSIMITVVPLGILIGPFLSCICC